MLDVYIILFIIMTTYGINYVLPVYYVDNCRFLHSFNSPLCLSVLSIISYNAYIHIYIFYALGLYCLGKVYNYVKNKIS